VQGVHKIFFVSIKISRSSEKCAPSFKSLRVRKLRNNSEKRSLEKQLIFFGVERMRSIQENP
jgi:hypothetical protein